MFNELCLLGFRGRQLERGKYDVTIGSTSVSKLLIYFGIFWQNFLQQPEKYTENPKIDHKI